MASKIGIVIYAKVAEDTARVYRALGVASEFKEAGDDVAVVFDGSGVESLAALSDDAHPLHGMLEGLRPEVRGGCGFCITSHGVADSIKSAGWTPLTDHDGHVSIRGLVEEGRQILNF